LGKVWSLEKVREKWWYSQFGVRQGEDLLDTLVIRFRTPCTVVIPNSGKSPEFGKDATTQIAQNRPYPCFRPTPQTHLVTGGMCGVELEYSLLGSGSGSGYTSPHDDAVLLLEDVSDMRQLLLVSMLLAPL
jgi:hypothetical protein